jgi:acyl dehydratase
MLKSILYSQEIQFKNPVYLNDELIFSVEVNGAY